MPLDSSPSQSAPQHPLQQEGILLPQGYELWGDGIYAVAHGTADAPIIPTIFAPLPSGSRAGRRRLSNRPLWIAQLGMTVDTREPLVKLGYVTLDGQISEAWVDRGQITDARALGMLGAGGLPVDSTSARDVLAYLRDLEVLVARAYPMSPVGSRSGPYLCGQQWGFLLGPRWIGPGHLEADPRRRSRHAAAYHPQGSWEEWREKWRELYEQSWVTRWITACSFAAPLLRHLGCRTFIVHIWTQSGAGKTAACHFALSAWGDPEQLYSSQNTTQIAVTEVFKHLTDLPVLFDEKQVATISSEELIYSVCLLRSRERGSKHGGLRHDDVKWNTLAFSTGEVPLVTSRDLGGQLSRVLQIHSAPFASKAAAEAVYGFTRQHYGHAGPLFLELLVRVLNEPGGIDTLRERYTALRQEIVQRVGHEGNHPGFTAAIALAQILSASWLLGIPAAEAQEYAIEDACRAVMETQPVQTLSYAERALAKLRDHWIENPAFYGDESGDAEDRGKERRVQQQYMIGIERPECMMYTEGAVNDLLVNSGFEPERVWRDFGALGWLILSPGGGLKTTAPLRNGKSPNHPVYAIRGEVFYTATRAGFRAVAGGGLPNAHMAPPPPLGVIPGGRT